MSVFALAILVVGVVTIAAIGLLLRRSRTKRLPVVDDTEYLKSVPESVSADLWIESRNEVARMWRIPSERLDPQMSLEEFGKHFSVLGDSGLDFDTIEEALQNLELSIDDMKKVATIGELLTLYAKATEKRSEEEIS